MWEADERGRVIPSREEMLAAQKKRHGSRLQEKFGRAEVAICGLGGLGSHVAAALARAGIGKLQLIDFDKVDLANLNRQQYFVSQIGMYKTDALQANLGQIAPYVKTKAHTVRITEKNMEELLQDAPIICEAFDGAKEKAMLVNGIREIFPDKYLIASSGMAGIASANSIKTRRLSKHFYLCGDGENGVSDQMGIFSPRVMACAAHQAHMILRIIAEEWEA